MTRCFISFDIDNNDILNKISSVQKILLDSKGDIKIVEPRNIHLTLKFLGEITEIEIQKVIEAIDKIEFSPFEVSLKGIGFFPSPHRMRVIWIGVENGAEEITGISSLLESNLRSIGFRPDKKKFSPHLTIARVKSKRNLYKLYHTIVNFENEDFGLQKIEAVKLKKSTLTPKGPEYTTIYKKS